MKNGFLPHTSEEIMSSDLCEGGVKHLTQAINSVCVGINLTLLFFEKNKRA